MNKLAGLKNHLSRNGFGNLQQQIAVTGGDICQAEHCLTDQGEQFFLKTLNNAPSDLLPTEAAGLNAIAATNTIATPTVLYVDSHCLALEHIPQTTPNSQDWQQLGMQLAQLHQIPQPWFGFEHNNYCGRTPQPNPKHHNGFEFFAQHRLLQQMQRASNAGLLAPNHCQQIEHLCQRLPELLPNAPPTLIHGDLWSGNVLFNQHHAPYLIDPACHYGWAESDIAMTLLFGGFADSFYQAYQEHHPLTAGWQHRAHIHNLYHLLNHLNLFGDHYLPNILITLKRYA